MSTPALITVVYPSTPTLKFDMDYYLTKHLPLVKESWEAYGLTQYYVADLRASGGPYAVQATMVFETGVEGFKKAAAEKGKAVVEDVSNFSSEASVRLVGNIVGKMA